MLGLGLGLGSASGTSLVLVVWTASTAAFYMFDIRIHTSTLYLWLAGVTDELIKSRCKIQNETAKGDIGQGPIGQFAQGSKLGKSSESVHCAITGPCLRMCHRPSARGLYRFGRFAINWPGSETDWYQTVIDHKLYNFVKSRCCRWHFSEFL